MKDGYIDLKEAFKATKTDQWGNTVEYFPCALLVSEGDHYLVLRPEQNTGLLEKMDLLLLKAVLSESGGSFEVVEDIAPYEEALRMGLGFEDPVKH